jgi:hypothetical protein
VRWKGRGPTELEGNADSATGCTRLRPRWSVAIIGKRLQHIGTIEATEREAMEAAVKTFRAELALRNKLATTKVKN